MDLLKSNHTVPLEKADKAPLKQIIDPTPQYATDGDPAQGIPATIFPAYHYNSLISEIVNAIKAGGLEPNSEDWGQLASIITDFIEKIDNLDDHFNNIKEVGKDEQGVYVIYEENDQDQKTYILSPSDLDDIKKRLDTAEGTIINHTSRLNDAEATIINHTGRLDNYGNSINRIFNTELPGKADLNGNSNQDFYAKNIDVSFVATGGIGVGGTNGIGNDQRLWGFSPQLFNDDEGNFSRIAALNLVYAGADGADGQPGESKQIMQIMANRSKYTTGDIGSAENKSILHTRSVNLFSDCSVYGIGYFKNGTVGARGDIAENYKSDRVDYIPGQIMMYSIDGDSEVELCTNPQYAFGVISTEPSHLMNAKEETDPDFKQYVPIVMVGRVPVLVEGPITRKDHIQPTKRGTGIASRNPCDIWLGRPVKDDLNEGTRLVECFVKAVM